MRAVRLGSIALLIVSASWVDRAEAQGSFDAEFDDEFADEFADESDGETQPPTAAGEPSEGEFADEFGDEFADEGSAEPSTNEGNRDGDESGEVDGVAPASAGSGGEDPEEAEGAAAEPEPRSAQRFRYHNTLEGPTGGLRLVDAAAAEPQTFRVQLATEFFFADDFLNSGDSNSHVGGFFSVSWAVHEFVEVFGSISSFANSNDTEDPSLFQVLGDTILGAKAGTWVLPWLSVGGDLSIAFLNTVGDIGLVLGGTSAGFRGNVSADFRMLPAAIPLLARFNLQYYLDNSANLIEDVESARYGALPPGDRRSFADEDRQLITRVERYALDINRTDFLNVGLGVEAPFEVMNDFFVQPLAEWTWRIPINRQGYDCLFIPAVPGSDEPAAGNDGCLDRQGLGSFPMRLSLGVRVLPPVKGLSALAAVDVGLTGTSTFVRELSPTAPYNVMLTVGYAYDTSEPDTIEPVALQVERRIPVEGSGEAAGRVVGRVIDQATGAPVDGAIISFADDALTRLITSPDGAFTTYRLDPGEVTLQLSHPHFRSGACTATISEDGGDVEAQCPLVSLPRVGSLSGRVTGPNGAPVSAEVRLTGPAPQTVQTDAQGRFDLPELPTGSYTAQAVADAFFVTSEPVEIETQGLAQVELALSPKPRRPLVRIRPRALSLRRPIRFEGNTAELASATDSVLAEIADALFRTPRITELEVQAHTDNQGAPQRLLELSVQRAEAVRQRLIELGVAPNRVQARGLGMTRPLAPNITPANRARNRRIQLVITGSDE